MFILTLFLSSLFLSHLFLSFSRSLCLSRSVSLFLLSLLLSLAVSLQVFVNWYLYVSRTRARSFSASQTFSVFLSLSPFVFCSPALSFSFSCIHICTYQSWEACTQPHLSSFTLGNSLASISANLNVAEVSHTRCLTPMVAQVPHIFVHFHALSVLGGGSLSPWSFHCSLQSPNLSLQSVLCLLSASSATLLATIARALTLHHQIHYVGSSACQTRICCTWAGGGRLVCSSGGVHAAGTVAIHYLFVKLLQAGEQGGTGICSIDQFNSRAGQLFWHALANRRGEVIDQRQMTVSRSIEHDAEDFFFFNLKVFFKE